MLILYRDCGLFSIAVEGDKDREVLDQVLDNMKWKVKCLFGYENVVDLIKTANENKMTFVLGIIDTDYHRISSKTGHIMNSIENLIYTDYHDIETMLFISNAYTKYLSVCASSKKIASILDTRAVILEKAQCIGALRLLGLENQINLWFSEMNYSKFIKRCDLSLDISALINHIVGRTNSHNGQAVPLKMKEIVTMIDDYLSRGYSQYDLCNGHDILNILSIAMTSLFASKKTAECTEDSVFEGLLLAYSKEEFLNTMLAKSIATWLQRAESIA